MIEKYKYRFKTEQEFINDYGEDWRKEVPKQFPIFMDYLLGTELDLKKTTVGSDLSYYLNDRKEFVKSFNIIAEHYALRYCNFLKISPEMIKCISISPDYKPRKFVY